MVEASQPLSAMPKAAKRRAKPRMCPHGRCQNGYYCKECGGKGICEHGRRRRQRKVCGGKGLCEHGCQKSRCKECGGKGICEHGREKRRCKECGGSAICKHGRRQVHVQEVRVYIPRVCDLTYLVGAS